jgi:hypothetical protein
MLFLYCFDLVPDDVNSPMRAVRIDDDHLGLVIRARQHLGRERHASRTPRRPGYIEPFEKDAILHRFNVKPGLGREGHGLLFDVLVEVVAMPLVFGTGD